MTRFLGVATALLLPLAASAQGLTVKGSDTMVILAQRWAEAYMKVKPGARVQVTGGGSGVGIAALVNGTTDVANASRPLKDAEKKQVQGKYGVPAVETPVAKDGVAFYVHASNPVQTLTIAQLKGIYAGDIKNWKEVGGKDAPIGLYSRENSSGTYAYVKDEVLGKGVDFAANAQTLPGTAAVVNAVAKAPDGIGYGGAAYAKGVRELRVAAKAGEAGELPTKANVLSGKYPLSRDLLMVTRGAPAGAAKAFMDWALTKEGQAIVETVGYYPVLHGVP
ncbi:MAG: phosphate ABC transporter substrate-binding protein [Anaeromyxobacteraceae bacterium]